MPGQGDKNFPRPKPRTDKVEAKDQGYGCDTGTGGWLTWKPIYFWFLHRSAPVTLSVGYTSILGSLLSYVPINSRWRFAIILLNRFELNNSNNMNQEIFPHFHHIATSSLIYRAHEEPHCFITKNCESWSDSFRNMTSRGWKLWYPTKMAEISKLSFFEFSRKREHQFKRGFGYAVLTFYESGFYSGALPL